MVKSICGAAVLLVMLAGTVMAQTDGVRQVNLLAEQAHRALRIAKSTCFVMSGSDSKLHAETAREEARQFEEVMQTLIAGAADPTLAAGPDPALEDLLSLVGQRALGVTRSAAQIVSGDFHSVPMRLLLSRNQGVADKLLSAARSAGPGYLDRVLSEGQQAALHHLAAQRALIEELLRDLCYLRLSFGSAALPDDMMDKIARFESVNTALIEGDPVRGLPEAPNIGIKIGLGQVASKWVSLRALLEAAARGGPLDLRDLQLASVIGETLNQRLTRLIGKYAQA